MPHNKKLALLWDQLLGTDEKKYFLKKAGINPDLSGSFLPPVSKLAWEHFAYNEQRRIIREIKRGPAVFTEAALFLETPTPSRPMPNNKKLVTDGH